MAQGRASYLEQQKEKLKVPKLAIERDAFHIISKHWKLTEFCLSIREQH